MEIKAENIQKVAHRRALLGRVKHGRKERGGGRWKEMENIYCSGASTTWCFSS